jgi:hypothetical protein
MIAAKRPSGENEPPMPNLRRLAGDPSVRRMYVAYPPPELIARPCSEKSNHWPSRLMSVGQVQSSQDMSFGAAEAGVTICVSRRWSNRAISASPPRKSSRLSNAPAERTVRPWPESDEAPRKNPSSRVAVQ